MVSLEYMAIVLRLLFEALLEIEIRLLARFRMESICRFIFVEMFGGRSTKDTLFIVELFGDA